MHSEPSGQPITRFQKLREFVCSKLPSFGNNEPLPTELMKTTPVPEGQEGQTEAAEQGPKKQGKNRKHGSKLIGGIALVTIIAAYAAGFRYQPPPRFLENRHLKESRLVLPKTGKVNKKDLLKMMDEVHRSMFGTPLPANTKLFIVNDASLKSITGTNGFDFSPPLLPHFDMNIIFISNNLQFPGVYGVACHELGHGQPTEGLLRGNNWLFRSESLNEARAIAFSRVCVGEFLKLHPSASFAQEIGRTDEFKNNVGAGWNWAEWLQSTQTAFQGAYSGKYKYADLTVRAVNEALQDPEKTFYLVNKSRAVTQLLDEIGEKMPQAKKDALLALEDYAYGRTKKFVSNMDSLISKYPKDPFCPVLKMMKAQALLDLKKPNEAEKILEELASENQNLRNSDAAVLMLANLYYQNKDYGRVTQFVEQFIELPGKPDKAAIDAVASIIERNFRDSEEWQKPMELAEKFTSRFPDSERTYGLLYSLAATLDFRYREQRDVITVGHSPHIIKIYKTKSVKAQQTLAKAKELYSRLIREYPEASSGMLSAHSLASLLSNTHAGTNEKREAFLLFQTAAEKSKKQKNSNYYFGLAADMPHNFGMNAEFEKALVQIYNTEAGEGKLDAANTLFRFYIINKQTKKGLDLYADFISNGKADFPANLDIFENLSKTEEKTGILIGQQERNSMKALLLKQFAKDYEKITNSWSLYYVTGDFYYYKIFTPAQALGSMNRAIKFEEKRLANAKKNSGRITMEDVLKEARNGNDKKTNAKVGALMKKLVEHEDPIRSQNNLSQYLNYAFMIAFDAGMKGQDLKYLARALEISESINPTFTDANGSLIYGNLAVMLNRSYSAGWISKGEYNQKVKFMRKNCKAKLEEQAKKGEFQIGAVRTLLTLGFIDSEFVKEYVAAEKRANEKKQRERK